MPPVMINDLTPGTVNDSMQMETDTGGTVSNKVTVGQLKTHFQDGLSPTSHNHDGEYSPLGHNHDGVYSLVSHDHDSVYSPLVHNHDGEYSPLVHNHDSDYSAIDHVHVTTITLKTTITTLTNHPSTLRFLLAAQHTSLYWADLRPYTEIRIFVHVGTSSNSVNTPRVMLRYKTGAVSGTVGSYSAITSPEFSATLSSIGTKDSGWRSLISGAIDEVFLCLVDQGGNGSADPVVGNIYIVLR